MAPKSAREDRSWDSSSCARTARFSATLSYAAPFALTLLDVSTHIVNSMGHQKKKKIRKVRDVWSTAETESELKKSDIEELYDKSADELRERRVDGLDMRRTQSHRIECLELATVQKFGESS